jgi:hypothetical protein
MIEQELKTYFSKLPDFMKDLKKIEEVVDEFKYENNEQKFCVTNQLTMVLAGIKYFHFLPTYMINECGLTESKAQQIAERFYSDVIDPIKAEYLSVILKIYNNETDIKFDPDEAMIIKRMFETKDFNIQDFKGTEMPVPKPPKIVSPRVQQASERLQNIRPKPRQGTEDPYRETID